MPVDEPLRSSLVLTIEEMQAVARPHTAPADIARWFHENGFTFKIAPDGYPVISRQHFEEAMGSHGGRLRRASKSTDLSGKDYLSKKEAAHYCAVSLSQFEKQASAYGIWPVPFMGKQIYRRTDLQRAIEREWQRLESLADRISSTGETGRGSDTATFSERLALSRRKRHKDFSDILGSTPRGGIKR